MGGFRALRLSSGSSGGSRGFRIPMGNRTPRVDTDTTNATPTSYRPFMRPRMPFRTGTVWKVLAIIIGLIAFGGCACVGLGFLLQALGYGQ